MQDEQFHRQAVEPPSNDGALKKAERDSSFELLRIISMLSIVFFHFSTHAGFEFDLQSLSVSRFWCYFIEMGNYGVNIFVLISGYFLVESQSEVFNIKRVLKFWGQIFFYSVLIYILFGIAGISEFSLKSFVKAVLPITFEQWWFASTYFVLYLLHPYINVFLNRLDRKTFQSLLVLMIIICCIIPSFTLQSFQSNSLLWFITLYSTAGYIRIFGLNPKFGIRHYICFWLLFSALRYLTSVIMIVLGTRSPTAARYTLIFYGIPSVLTFLSALSLFMVFKYVKMGYHKWINVIASASFGVYLIHDSKIVRPFIWETLFKNTAYQDTALVIPYSIGVVCLIYALCTIIDLIRQGTVEKAFLSFVNKNADRILKPFAAIIASCKKIVFGNQAE